MKAEHKALLDRMRAGDRTALARLMTLVEGRGRDTVAVMSGVHEWCGGSRVVGVTGPPGAGKSTLLDRLVASFRRDDLQVGIVAVDPSSPFSGGAVLGDRIRMQEHFLDPGVFIRSLSARGSGGGLARATRHVVRLLDAFGKDVVLVETVGVGQSELDIMRVADTVVVVLVPEAGDTIQAMKAGLLEIADVLVVNKADREGAGQIKAELESMAQMRRDRQWEIPVILTVARTGQGVDDLRSAVEAHGKFLAGSGEGTKRTAAGRVEEFSSTLRDELDRRMATSLKNGAFEQLLKRVEQSDLDPYGAALMVMGDKTLVATLLGRRDEEDRGP